MLQTFFVPAGGRQIDTKASFFRYESSGIAGADEQVRVRVDGSDLGVYLPGDSIRIPVAATRWEITPLGATQTCTVRLGLGQVDTARLIGNVHVIDAVSAAVQTAALGLGLAVTGAPTATQIVAPATNVRGLLLRSLVLSAAAGGGGLIITRLIAAPTAPVGYFGAQMLYLATLSNSTAAITSEKQWNLNRRIPAGWGIYTYHDITTAAATVHDVLLSFETA